ncbi:hypothetical protein LMH87_004695 [Akanthomyces muscarius]|uniref:Uncharacterized protein n=1 Tax=Akanthomyces muscarius TaxID=2231603 RepID=A0A9W8Q4K3_AKAMU|nr:hypothetical protein LMH87_004695 [Akanthomyces muscarius]KAJ4145863.1 hypothetical protein LMH87_004695 [Akanthomyces muscarius]
MPQRKSVGNAKKREANIYNTHDNDRQDAFIIIIDSALMIDRSIVTIDERISGCRSVWRSSRHASWHQTG